MVDFLLISTRPTKRGTIEIYPRFKLYPKSSDLMIRGGDFYAVWLEEEGIWSTDEQDALRLIDQELDKFAKENSNKFDANVKVLHMWDSESGMIDAWHKYCQKQCRDNFHMLDEKLVWQNSEVNKKDYASKKLNYSLEPAETPAYDKLMSTLYTPEERHKIEWAIGSIVCGASKKIQKFVVLYGSAGTGKSTVMNIIQMLFDGYYSVFDAKALGSSSNSFALEAFKTNPLVAIQHDGDLSRIEDNTRLNSLVSHELMTVNEKFKSTYANSFKCFLFMGTNKPVKITDAKSGLIRRLIDVTPSGNKLSQKDYKAAVEMIGWELGGIACHCQDVYMDNPNAYDNYIPVRMMNASNDFYNFIVDSYPTFKKNDGVTLKVAWEMYNTYCSEAKVAYPFSKRAFKEEMMNYFREYKDRFNTDDGTRVRSYYSGFRTEKFEEVVISEKEEREDSYTIALGDGTDSIFDRECASCLAQYGTTKETPAKKWDEVTTKLSDLDTHKLHYVKVPENHIVIDFDIPDENGEKSLEKNLKEASKWPPTYTELSKSGKGVHLHYIYNGDVNKVSRVYDDHIEIKVFTGKSSLRRKLTKCNDLPIATLNSGLPMKGEKKMVNFDSIQSEKGLRTMIEKNLNKEIHASTKPSVDFIMKILDDAYESGLHYDVTDMRPKILSFAANSTNQSDYCIKAVNKMKFKSEEPSEFVENSEAPIVFYDVEVFPNLFLVNWKVAGLGKTITRWINPKPEQIEELLRYRLIGFNNRRYDNHMLYACMLGYTNEEIYNLSQRIINKSANAFFSEAYNLSYTDIYDFASAGNKMSLKKLEITMSNISVEKLKERGFSDEKIALIKAGTHHQELGLPWDKPVPEERWVEVAEYCDNDVIATEAAFNYLEADWTARQILADLAGSSVNDSTNNLTTKIIFGKEKHPQDQFNYRDLSQPVHDLDEATYDFLKEACPKMMSKTHGEDNSILPYFPGYKFERGKSTYRGEEIGEGGKVYAEPGIHTWVALLDIASQHPHSAIAECIFGPKFTRAFRDIVEGRVSIKHKAWDVVNGMLDGKLTPYIQKVIDGEMTAKQLANALKTAINSVYGLTSASFDNPFKDPRNKDNIVAKRGALFMTDLKYEVQKRGFTVAHIKTDSIKIPNATPEIIKFVMDFGEEYGYTFEHEATYEKMCLVNDAVYIAKYATAEKCEELYGYVPGDNKDEPGEWTATGTQFAVPYVFKTLFSKKPIVFEDMCETKSVTSALYLDMNESLPDVTDFEKELEKRIKECKDGKITENQLEEARCVLNEEIAKGHDYHFVGKVGLFCPIKPECGGGLLCREKDGKYSNATGAKGFRWLESEMVKELGKEDCIDRSYYQKLVDNAVDAISQYGDFEMFASDDPYIVDVPSDFMNIPEGSPEEVPFCA